ncbi:IQ domain-containing protein IQM1 [Ricinus communis]|uniref:Calmodulin binding protein, putative n=1 Tax=Ricinus communis TaxID=3988 RepID=B9RQR7_RICCO|nr:IQ domain-containing protein IQM1 [Ricinus communis]EEF46088.1 calmodulin binding protein, putative [Ricinus communis]|eukprot:XP_002516086.1 IQ domain-containing protein IQM1 [Ricinus communis]
MGLSLSLLLSAWDDILSLMFFGSTNAIEKVAKSSISLGSTEKETNSCKKQDLKEMVVERSLSFKNWDASKDKKASDSSKKLVKVQETIRITKPSILIPEPFLFFSPRPINELDAAATRVQKVYRSYRTRRNLADCAVVVEELWWKALEFAALRRSSVSFFNIEKHETAVSKWTRATTRAAKVGKGLSKDEKAQKLALQHWLEAIDPRHRYGHNLHLYYDIWCDSKSRQPFFYWLDIGDGKEINIEKCQRNVLQRQCIKYLGPKERDTYEVIVVDGKLAYRQAETLINTTEGSKWIFVLSTSKALYVGQKKKGAFQHSSFLSGGATIAAGRLVAHDGVVEAIWPYSGHYLPTEDNFKEFISFLEEHNVDLANVKRCAVDDDDASFQVAGEYSKHEEKKGDQDIKVVEVDGSSNFTSNHEEESVGGQAAKMEAPPVVFDMTKRLSCKWTSGVGPRIGCVRDYPQELQARALEQVNLSPRVGPAHLGSCLPIHSPRPSPKLRVSPRLAYMGLPSPRVSVTSG